MKNPLYINDLASCELLLTTIRGIIVPRERVHPRGNNVKAVNRWTTSVSEPFPLSQH
jgi:hypothetical protein